MKHIEGIVPACITPFNDDFSVNHDIVRPLVDDFVDAGVGGVFVNGSSAEFLTLTTEERKQQAEAFVEAADGRVPVVIHVGAKALETAVELAGHAELIGADAVATLPPLDRKNSTIDKDFEWYKAVGAASELPLYVYLRSDMGSSNIQPKEFLHRTEDIRTFKGGKFGDSNFHILQGIKQQTEGRINMLTGPDELLAAGLVMGSDGAIGTTYNAFPRLAVRIFNSIRDGDVETAMKLQGQLGEFIGALIEEQIVIPGTKAVKRRQGWAVGECRPTAVYGETMAAHTETKFNDHVTPRQEARLMAIVDKYDMN